VTQKENPNRIVTFIASPTSFDIGDYSNVEKPPNVSDPSLIGKAWDMLVNEAKALPVGDDVLLSQIPQSTHMVVRVASVDKIAAWLAAFYKEKHSKSQLTDEEKIRVQIIGHSSPGSMALGSSWIAAPVGSDIYAQAVEHPYLTLSSTPSALVFLSRWTGWIDEVVLAGCYVGMWQTNGFPVNGRTLMFTFAEMWHCKVRGALNKVSEANFEHGWYRGPEIGWAWHDTRPPVAIGGNTTALTPDTGMKLSTPTAIEVSGESLNGDDRAEFAAYFDACVTKPDQTPSLAIKELAVELSYGDKRYPAALMCGGMFLALDTDDTESGRRYYCNSAMGTSSVVSRLFRDQAAATLRSRGAQLP